MARPTVWEAFFKRIYNGPCPVAFTFMSNTFPHGARVDLCSL